MIPFEATSQEEAIRLGKQKVAELTETVDRWALAREGLRSLLGSDSSKLDLLSVTAWSNGLDEPVILQQCFSPTAKGTFRLLDPIKIVVHGVECSEEIKARIMPTVLSGINQHPRGENWVRWQPN